ncbi:hypothetical protein [Streptomyces sp. NPDC060198]|uniref:hypothetical protein n=1 Tax=Streptomyces sp. NPDC060198 TaxID=3347070 RepID=UPI0036585E00
MTSEDLLALLQLHHESLVTELGREEREEVTASVRDLREAVTAGQAPRAARAVRRLRRALSPLPSAHPVAEALAGRRYASAGAGSGELPALAAVNALLRALRDEPPGPEDLRRTVRRRLLGAPALTERERLLLLADEHAVHGLIRLHDDGAGARYPRFQFSPGTVRPLPVVLRVNEVLRADIDPWGAAGWWLGGNAWLRGIPADLLGLLPDADIELAAVELVEAD